MEDNLIFLENGRRPQSLVNGKLTSYFGILKTTCIFLQEEDDLIFLENGRKPKNLCKWKMNIFKNKRRTQILFKLSRPFLGLALLSTFFMFFSREIFLNHTFKIIVKCELLDAYGPGPY
jgi:hypothetical protein